MMSEHEAPSLTEYRCAHCHHLSYGPTGTDLIGISYLGGLYAFQSAALGCPHCGGAIEELLRLPEGPAEVLGQTPV